MSLKSQNKINPNFNMSSMTDIVFLLLIFFMLTSTLVVTNALDLVLPSSSAPLIKKQKVSISIVKESADSLMYYLDNVSVELNQLEFKLQEKLSFNSISDSINLESTILLRVDKSIAMEHAVNVLDIAYRNNYKIVLATQPN